MDKKEKIYKVALYVAGILFFIFCQGEIGWVMGGDSEQFLSFGYTAGVMPMPLYPLFLRMMHVVFGESVYLYIVMIMQSVLAGCCTAYFADYIRKQFHLNFVEGVIAFFVSLFPFIILLPEDPISHGIMTEAISYPLFYVYIVLILKAIYNDKKIYLYGSTLLIFFMSLVRPQMKFLFAVSGVVYFYIVVKNRIIAGKENTDKWYIGKTAVFFLVLLVSLKVITITVDIYQRVMFDTPASNYSYMAIVERGLYACDAEDEALYEEEYLKEIFRKTYAEMEEQQANYKYMGEGFGRWNDIVRGTTTCSRIVGKYAREYLVSNGELSSNPVKEEAQVSEIFGAIGTVLVKDNHRQYLVDSMNLMPAGIVSTVLFHKESIYGLIHATALFLYVAAIGLSIWVYVKKKHNTQIAEYMLLITGTAILNVVSSNMVLFGLQRYLAYTLGMFYLGMLLVIRDFWRVYFRAKK